MFLKGSGFEKLKTEQILYEQDRERLIFWWVRAPALFGEDYTNLIK